jgi:hypothetical protein
MYRSKKLPLPAALLLTAAALSSGCSDRRHDPDDFSPTAPGVVNTLKISSDKMSITADGSSTAVITAEINPDAVPGRRTVEFTTSTGTFVGAPTGTPMQMAVEAVQGKASVTLKSSNKAEIASIEAKIKDGQTVLATAHTEVRFEAADLNAIQLTATSASIPADGFSRTQLVATISPNAPSDRRAVVFTASRGTLVNGSGTPSSIRVVAGRDNTARAELVSSRTLETSIVEAVLEGVTGAVDSVTVRFEPPNPADLIQVTTSVREAPADGQTVVQVTATVPPNLPSGDRTVTFTTTAGTLLQTSATADASNRATVDLRADTRIVTALLRATASVATATTTLPFVRALPDFIIVNPAAGTIKADGTTKVGITVDLRRNVGTVTEGTVVEFSAFDEDGDEVDLLFRDIKPSNANQVVTANVIAPADTPRGTVTIRATVEEGGRKIEGEEKIVVVD